MAERPPAHGQKFSSQPRLARSDNASGRKSVPTPASAKLGRESGARASTPARSAFRAEILTRTAASKKGPAESAVTEPGSLTPEPLAWVPISAAPRQTAGASRRSRRAVAQPARLRSAAPKAPPALGLATLAASRGNQKSPRAWTENTPPPAANRAPIPAAPPGSSPEPRRRSAPSANRRSGGGAGGGVAAGGAGAAG